LTPQAWLALAAIGVCGVIADGAFATASRMGDLSVVSVLSSLYSVVTVLLAFALLCERVRCLQLAGVGLALTGSRSSPTPPAAYPLDCAPCTV
jgi:drug/metabolite transporter (DMT)-like permease